MWIYDLLSAHMNSRARFRPIRRFQIGEDFQNLRLCPVSWDDPRLTLKDAVIAHRDEFGNPLAVRLLSCGNDLEPLPTLRAGKREVKIRLP